MIAAQERPAEAALLAPMEVVQAKANAPEDFANCMVEVRGQCVFGSRHASFEMSVIPGKGLVLKLPSKESGRPIVTAIGEDLRSRQRSLELTEDEAELISNDIGNFDGTLYAIPKVDELKKTLGFPKDTSFETEDFRELVRVHIQLTLGVGGPTAAYLCDRLGVTTRTLPKEEPKTEAAASIETALTPTHN